MSLIKIKYGNSGKLSLTVNNFIALGKTFADITGVIFMLKDDATQLDTAAPFKKEYPSAGITLVDPNIIVQLDVVDFGAGKLVGDSTYLIAVGVEFNDSGEYFEDKDDSLSRKLKVVNDKVRK
jgi:hypothetical protein